MRSIAVNTSGDVTSSATGYKVNEMNEYDFVGSAEHQYDANGNLASDSQRHFHYDVRNRLVRVSTLAGNTVANYNYDALNRRTRKAAGSSVTVFHYLGKQVMEERNLLGQMERQFVYGEGIDNVLQMKTAANDYYYHANSLGSIAAVTDGNANVVERYNYDAYGVTEITSASGAVRDSSEIGNPYRYTARRFDSETGLYYYRARHYSAELGRFIQRDPLQYVDGMNMYAYVRNNPTNLVDPLGFDSNPYNNIYPNNQGVPSRGDGYADGRYDSTGDNKYRTKSDGSGKPHEGVDLKGNIGDPVYADRDGTATPHFGNDYGKWVRIMGDDGSSSRYIHLNSRESLKERRVKKGDEVGKVGKSGNADRPHLHYEKRDKNGNPIDPSPKSKEKCT